MRTEGLDGRQGAIDYERMRTRIKEQEKKTGRGGILEGRTGQQQGQETGRKWDMHK